LTDFAKVRLRPRLRGAPPLGNRALRAARAAPDNPRDDRPQAGKIFSGASAKSAIFASERSCGRAGKEFGAGS